MFRKKVNLASRIFKYVKKNLYLLEQQLEKIGGGYMPLVEFYRLVGPLLREYYFVSPFFCLA